LGGSGFRDFKSVVVPTFSVVEHTDLFSPLHLPPSLVFGSMVVSVLPPPILEISPLSNASAHSNSFSPGSPFGSMIVLIFLSSLSNASTT
jgi:hypothetical protein